MHATRSMRPPIRELVPADRVTTSSPHARGAPEGAGPRRLLLAEDDGPFRYLLASALRQDGYEVLAVANGVDLIDILEDSLSRESPIASFDLVLSDLRMPGWPGLEALAKFGANPGMPPFILFTAFGDEETHERARAIGAVALLDKPFDIDELRAVVVQVLC
jgi:CheY-like chemotaxis protein